MRWGNKFSLNKEQDMNWESFWCWIDLGSKLPSIDFSRFTRSHSYDSYKFLTTASNSTLVDRACLDIDTEIIETCNAAYSVEDDNIHSGYAASHWQIDSKIGRSQANIVDTDYDSSTGI